MRIKRLPLPYTLLLCVLGGGVTAWAGPTTTPLAQGEIESVPAPAARDSAPQKGGIVGLAATPDVPNTSNTIKMLLELQATTAPGASAADSGRAAPRAAGSRPDPQTPSANPFGKVQGPDGASPEFARPAASPGVPGGGVDWHAPPNSVNVTVGSARPAGMSGGSPDPFSAPAQRSGGAWTRDAAEQRWWMPSVWIRWVREHRQEVLVGAAVALALAWAGASRAGTRRR